MKTSNKVKNIAWTITALITVTSAATSAFAGRPMRGVPTPPSKAQQLAKLKSEKKSTAKPSAIRNSALVTGDIGIGYASTRSCRFVPLAVNEQLWIPSMYIEPSAEFKGIYQPLVSEGMIANDANAQADAKRVWPNSSKQWMAIPEIDYTSTVYDLDTAQGVADRDFILGLHATVISRTEAEYQARKTASNIKSESILNASENAKLKTALAKFIVASGAAEYNKSLCDRFVQSGESNDGVTTTLKSNIKNIAQSEIDSTYATVSSSAYLISDLYYVNGQDGIVSYDRKRSFLVGYSREPGMTTEVYGCSLCHEVPDFRTQSKL